MSYQLDPTASLQANLVVRQPIEVRDSASQMGGLIFSLMRLSSARIFSLEYTDGAGPLDL